MQWLVTGPSGQSMCVSLLHCSVLGVFATLRYLPVVVGTSPSTQLVTL
jgi:hypothetical protein